MKLIAMALLAAGCHGPSGSAATQAADKTDVARIQDGIAKLNLHVDGVRARVGVLQGEVFGARVRKVSPTESEPEFYWWCGVTSCTRYEQTCTTIDEKINATAGVKCVPRRIAWCPIGKPAAGVPHCFADLEACRISEVADGVSSCFGVE
jgi:hypothetical protein